MSPAETTIVLIVAILVIGFVIKWVSREEKPEAPARAPDSVDQLLAEVSGVEPETAAEVVAITSDGWAFVPDGDEVQLIPPDTHDEDVPVRSEVVTGLQPQIDPDIQIMGGRGGPVDPRTHRPVSQWKLGQHLDAGDLIAARVKRGAPDFDPWRLEAIGRDRDYRAWFFETEEAARAALDLLQRRVVRALKDADGDPVAVGPEDFDRARREDEETEQALDQPADE
jgi:hypothetical protein